MCKDVRGLQEGVCEGEGVLGCRRVYVRMRVCLAAGRRGDVL